MQQRLNSTQTPAIVNWLAIVVFLMVFAVFLPALKHAFVDFDDPDNFLLNPHYRGLGWENIKWMFTTFHMGHYQPLTWLTLGLDAVCSEKFYHDPLDPRCYHFTNNLLHSINAALVFLIALRLLRGPNERSTSHSNSSWAIGIGAMAAALFFGVHPLRVESVAWITERRDLLSGFFVLLSVLAYLRANRLQRNDRLFWLSIAFGLFALSLLSKVMGVTLPVVLLILDWYPLGRLDPSPRKWVSPPSRGVVLEKIPFLALSIAFSAIASFGQASNHWLVTLDMHGPWQRAAQACYGLVFYMWKTMAPSGLIPFYEMRFPLDVREPRFVVSAGIVLVVAIVVLILFVRRRLSSVIAAVLVYVVMLLPVLGFMQNGQQLVADRYSYLPCIGWAILVGAGVAMMMQATKKSIRIAGGALALMLIGALSVLTVQQTMIWRSTTSLWTYAGENDLNNSRAQNGYGFVLLADGRLDEAIDHLRRAIAVVPANDKAHINLWTALRNKGDDKGLLTALDYSATIETLAARAQFQRGLWFMSHTDYMDASDAFNEVLKREPKNAQARTNIGWILNKQGQVIPALKEYEQAVRDDPNLFQARYNFGLELAVIGKNAEAIEQFQEALRLNPSHAGAKAQLEHAMKEPH